MERTRCFEQKRVFLALTEWFLCYVISQHKIGEIGRVATSTNVDFQHIRGLLKLAQGVGSIQG